MICVPHPLCIGGGGSAEQHRDEKITRYKIYDFEKTCPQTEWKGAPAGSAASARNRL